MLKLLILTTDKSLLKWKSLPSKLAFIKKALNSGENADFEVEVKYTDSTPLVTNGRVDHAWLEEHNRPYFSQGYDLIGFHMSRAQWKELGLIESLRGSNPRDNSEQEDFYFSSDEKNKRKGEDRFTQVCLHEASHAYHQETGEVDLTHMWHDRNPDISGLFKLMDWSLYQPRRMKLKTLKNLLESLLGLLRATNANIEPTRPKLPVKDGLQPLVERQAQKVLDEMKSFGYEMRITQGFRSIEEQNRLYAQGRTTKGNIVTNAKGGQSFHNYGVAVDYVFRKQGYDAPDYLWGVFGLVGKKHGFEWGGDWKGFVDRPHLEMTLGHSLKDFQTNKVNWNKYV